MIFLKQSHNNNNRQVKALRAGSKKDSQIINLNLLPPPPKSSKSKSKRKRKNKRKKSGRKSKVCMGEHCK